MSILLDENTQGGFAPLKWASPPYSRLRRHIPRSLGRVTPRIHARL